MDESYKALEDALKYEGETMGHCVGGYCPDVASGQSRIYSLRDKKGQPHVTIEVRPSTQSAMSPSEFYQQKDAPESMLRKINEAEAAGYLDDIGSLDDFVRASPEYNEYLNSLPQEIVQIKGKANRAPKEEYLPAVQDFIRSGKWANVGDAQNAGLRHYNSVFNDEELHILGDYNVKMPEHGYLTGEEIQQLHNLITPEGMRLKYDAKGNIIGGDESSGFATGGLVSGANFPTGDFDPARIDSIVDQLHAMNAG
jgi:hypothetical protein